MHITVVEHLVGQPSPAILGAFRNPGASDVATDGTILVFASDANRWGPNSRYVRSARVDQQGRWQVKGLPAGEYFLAALDYVEDGIWNDPDYLGSIHSTHER
jgi:hypothetical protein